MHEEIKRADGKLLFETGIDTTGVEQGMAKVSTIAAGTLVADAAKQTASAVVGIAKAAIQTGETFETSMSQVAATMGITTDEIEAGSESFEMLKDKAKEMGATTKYTASEAAEGLNILAMAGLSAEEACDGIADVMALAGAGAISLEASATYVTGAVKGFNDEMSNASKYTDIMAKGATMANTTVAGLGEALSGVSATSNAYNQSVESTSVALLRLAEQNVTGSEAATALSRAMADLYTPTDKAATALQELGIAAYDDAGNARDFNDVVDDLNGRLSEMTDQEKLAYESTIFTTFGMKAFQKMTVSTTDTVNKFKEGIAEASGSAMQQFETQTDNLEGKLAILNSALEATGIAIYEVFDDTLKEAAEGATDAIDRIHDSIENGELKDSFERLSSSFADFVSTAIDMGEKALPVLINGLSFLMDNAGAILSGFIAYEAATIAAKIATMDFTAALMANPIGLIATACALAVAGVVKLTGEVRNISDETKEMAGSAKDAVEASERLSKSSQEATANMKAEASYVKHLAEQLKMSQSQGKLDEEQKKRVAAIVSQLNTAVEGLNLQIDEETGLLLEGQEAWESYIETQMKQAQLEAINEELKDLEKQRLENEIELIKVSEQLSDSQKKIADDREYLDSLALKVDLTEEESKALEEYQEVMMDATDDEKLLMDRRQELNAVTEDLQKQEDILNTYMEEEIGNLDEMASGTKEAAAGTDTLVESSEEAEEELKELAKEVESLTGKLDGQINSFDKAAEVTKQNKNDIIKNLEDQQKAMTEWADNMQILVDRGINDGILEQLANMGPEGAGYVQAFVDMTGDELDRAAEAWVTSLAISESVANDLASEYFTAGTHATMEWVDGAWQPIQDGTVDQIPQAMVENVVGSEAWNNMPETAKTAVTNAVNSMKEAANEAETVGEQMVQSVIKPEIWDKMPESAKTAVINARNAMVQESSTARDDGLEMGKQYGEGEAEGIQSTQDDVKKAAQELNETVVSTSEDTLQMSTGGNSGVAKDIGTGFVGGEVEGITAKTGDAVNAATSLGKQTTTALKNNATRSDGYEVGSNIAAGMAQGISDGTSSVVAAAKSMAQAAVKEAKAELQIKSPSRVFKEIGEFCVAGFNSGLESMSVESTMGRNIQAQLGTMMASVENTGGGYNQTVNVYSKSYTPDELAREIRLETKYGIREV